MSDIPSKPRVKRNTVPPWWEHQWCQHPMSDEAFSEAFMFYVMCRSPDHTLRKMRERVAYFVRTLMRQEMAESLAQYRQEHPLG